MYAVVELQWHQYIVSQNNELIVDSIDLDIWKNFDRDVLAIFNEDWSTCSLWTPCVSWASVSFEVISHQRWEKIRVLKFKRKNRYERNFGHRSYLTTLLVKSLNG
jgi:large subunit ribosomal protein L21